MSKFYLKTVVVEEAPAWVECEECNGIGKTLIVSQVSPYEETCHTCNGEGGKWHGAVEIDHYRGERRPYVGKVGAFATRIVTKSSILVREWTCSFYDSPGHAVALDGAHTPCSRCTVGEWRVKE